MQLDRDPREPRDDLMSVRRRIQELEGELSLRQRLLRLEEQAQQARVDHVAPTVREPRRRPSTSPARPPEPKRQRSSTFMLRPPDLRTYYGRTTREHRDWFRDIKDAIEASIPYFPDDTAKIQYALHYITADPKAAWREYSKIIPKDDWTWVGFEQFLLNRIEDPQNRHLAISKRYAEARQRPRQKTSDFANYLASLERDLEELSESMRRDNLLNKMQKGLYDKIIASQQIPETRETLISLATRLEAQLPGAPKEHSERKAPRSTETRSSNPETTSTQGAKSWNRRQEPKPRDRGGRFSRGSSRHNRQKHKDLNTDGIVCYRCHQKGHISKDCRNSPSPRISSANESGQKNNKSWKNPWVLLSLPQWQHLKHRGKDLKSYSKYRPRKDSAGNLQALLLTQGQK